MKTYYFKDSGKIQTSLINDLEVIPHLENNDLISYCFHPNLDRIFYVSEDNEGIRVYKAINGVITKNNIEVFTLQEIKDYYLNISSPFLEMSMSNLYLVLYDQMLAYYHLDEMGVLEYPINSLDTSNGGLIEISNSIELKNYLQTLAQAKVNYFSQLMSRYQPIIQTIQSATTQQEITLLDITL